MKMSLMEMIRLMSHQQNLACSRQAKSFELSEPKLGNFHLSMAEKQALYEDFLLGARIEDQSWMNPMKV